MKDRWGVEVAGDAASVAAWDDAWSQFLSFTGDPIATLSDAAEHDGEFVMGPVFIALYSVLGGQPLDAPAVVDNVERVRRRTDDSSHRPLIDHLALGNLFRRRGDDVQVELPLTFPELALGGEVDVPTLEGTTRIKVPPGSPPGKVLRLAGRGLPKVGRQTRGDLHLQIVLDMPDDLDAALMGA